MNPNPRFPRRRSRGKRSKISMITCYYARDIPMFCTYRTVDLKKHLVFFFFFVHLEKLLFYILIDWYLLLKNKLEKYTYIYIYIYNKIDIQYFKCYSLSFSFKILLYDDLIKNYFFIL